MDSPPDSLDIAKLKRVALGLDEIEKSEASSVTKADSQLSTSYSASTYAADIDECTGSTSFPEPHRSRSKFVGSVLAVHLVPSTSTSHDDARGSAAAGHSIVHEERLNASLESGIPKMSARDTVAGDTQPISQSIYENIISREKSFQSALHSQLKFSDDHVEGDENSLRTTAGEGESGHVNLLADFDSASVKHGVEPRCSSDDDEVDSLKDGHSSPSQFPSYNNVFPESQRFLTTPVTAKKRDQVPNMAATTPSHPRNPLAADLNSSGGILSLSQLFRATQTPTSPFIPRLPSGPLSDRPSPDLPIQARPRDQYTSSPSRTPGAGATLTRTHTDPFAYISMDESQKRRKESREDRRTKSAEDLSSAEPIDKLFEESSSLVQRLNRRRVIEQETSARLASISHERPLKSATADRSDASARPSNRAVSIEADETQEMSAPLDEEDMSEVETDKEDVPVASSHSQTRQVPLTSDEDKENQVSPYDDVVTTAAHDRLSQVLGMHEYSTLSDTSRLAPLDSGTGVHTTQSQQVINVRDSQPSPSQGGTTKLQKNLDLSQPESLHIQSSYDDSSPPTKRQRRQVLVKESSILQHDVQFERRNDQLVLSVRASTRVSQNQTSPADQNYSARSGTEKPSSMPSLVANTPTHKIAEDTIPETSIPESSPHRNQLPMQEVEEEDDDLPPQPPLRPRNSGSSSLEGATKRKRFFAGFSPEKGRIKTLTELSSDVSPQSSPGDDIDLNDFLRNEEDPHFSKIFKISTHNTPRKKLRTTKDYLSSQAASSPLKNVESIHPLNVEEHEQTEQHILDPESPSVTPMRGIARRQRVGTAARGEDMYEMAGSPRSQKKAQAPREFFSSQNLSERASPLEVSNLHSKHPPNRDLSQSSKDGEDKSQEMQTAPEDPLVPSGIQPSTRGLEVDTTTSLVQTPAPEDPIIAPNQVLAFWNGRKRAYYPATFMHSSDPQRCVVAFADSGPVDVALGSVKRLQLQIGDAIKIDFPNVPKVTHIIRGFSQQLKPEDLTQRNEYGYLPVTDIYGYSTVFVSPKQRKSLPGGGQIENEQTIEVPICSIYLDMILWNQMKGRSFTVSDSVAVAPPSKLQTPSRGASTPASPGSRLSRTHLTIRLGLFSGMVFAISLGKQDAHKTRLIKMITANGGQILEDGFEELFVFPSGAPGVIQAETVFQTDDVVEKAIDFRVTPNFENAGFACLIADRHSRRAKYMQALALNLPCLSRRWIEDCVEQNRILDWDHYLLPAGESSFLYGAIKSRVLTSVPADKALFSQTFNHRAKLLDGQSVLLVLGRGKLEERHKAYIFLMYALGAARISRVLDLNVARVLLQNHLQKPGQTLKWDWLYVDDSDEAAADGLMNELRQSFQGNRKKKQFGEGSSDDKGLLFPRVMSSDLVCQSLILGKICK